jgi:hypothetical protein
MIRNAAGQAIGAQLVSASDGSPFTDAGSPAPEVSVFIVGDNGAQAAGSQNAGQAVHKGNGYWSYAPSQAETDFAHIAFTFVATGAVGATCQVYTTHPQTGDAFARLGAPAGASIAADVATRASQASVDDLPTNAELATALAAADDAVLAAIGALNNLSSAQAEAAAAAALAAYDPPTHGELTAALAAADDAVLAAIAALNNLSGAAAATAVLTTQMTESYAANGVAPTLAQALFAIHQHLMHFSIAGTSRTVRQLNGASTAFTETLDDATAPTALGRAA